MTKAEALAGLRFFRAAVRVWETSAVRGGSGAPALVAIALQKVCKSFALSRVWRAGRQLGRRGGV